MLRTVAADPTGEDALWAEARSLLDRAPTESAEQRLGRWRRTRVLAAVAVFLSGTAVVLVVTVLFREALGERPSVDVPSWRAATGFGLAGAGLLLQLAGVVAIVRSSRRLRAWSSPLAVLTRSQRRELLASVRGSRPVEPDRVPLARLLAEQLIGQRATLVANVGLGIAFTGQWIASPARWRAVLTGVFALVVGVSWVFLQRDARRARRFLDEHPVVGTTPAE
jgi:hypothetical protein